MQIKANITKEEVNELPSTEYTGNIILIDNEEGISRAIEKIKESDIIGIDTETRPNFQKGVKNKFNVSLLQITTNEESFLFRLNKTGITKDISDIFENKTIKKVGIAIEGDIKAMNKLRKFKANSTIELQTIVKKYGLEVQGLQKIFAILKGKKIEKPSKIQLSNWNAETLTEKQKRYAATDSWACLEIYKSLIELENKKYNE